MREVGGGWHIRVVTEDIFEEITFELRPEWRKATSYEAREERTPSRGTTNAKVLRQEWGWYVRGMEMRLVWLSEKGRDCGRWGDEVGKARSVGLWFYLNAVGSQWKVLASSRVSNLWKDSAGLLTCKREKPPLFLTTLRKIDTPSWWLLSVGLGAATSMLAGPHLEKQTLKTSLRLSLSGSAKALIVLLWIADTHQSYLPLSSACHLLDSVPSCSMTLLSLRSLETAKKSWGSSLWPQESWESLGSTQFPSSRTFFSQ